MAVAFAETVSSNEVWVYVRPEVSCVAEIQNPRPYGMFRIGDSVRFKADIEPLGARYEYTWRWVDGVFSPATASESGVATIIASGQVVSSYKTYATSGTKKITLTVKPTVAVPVDLSATATCSITVSGLPDITANPPIPTGTTFDTDFLAGAPILLQGSLNNLPPKAGGPTPDGRFSNIYQISLLNPTLHKGGNTSADPDWVTLATVFLSPDTPPLAVGASGRPLQAILWGENASISPGTYYFRTCADDRGTVAETDESNNCSSNFTTVTVVSRPISRLIVKSTRDAVETSTNPLLSGGGVSIEGSQADTSGVTRYTVAKTENINTTLTAPLSDKAGATYREWNCGGTIVKYPIRTCTILVGVEFTKSATASYGGAVARPTVTCSHVPVGPVEVGDTVTWNAFPSGGSGSYRSFFWTYDGSFAGAPDRTKQSMTSYYTTPGNKYGRVEVTDSAGVVSYPADCASPIVVYSPSSFDYSISAKNAAMKPSETRTTLATLQRVSGTSRAVTLSVSRITSPAGTAISGNKDWLSIGSGTARFTVTVASQNPVNPTASINLQLQTQSETPLGAYDVELLGTASGGPARAGAFRVMVTSEGGQPPLPRFEEF